MLIYKIFRPQEWDAFQRDGQTAGSKLDRIDGYIHFSTAAQAPETVAKHFAGEAGLVIAACDTVRFVGSLHWEVSRGGDKFPHVYRTLSLRDVTWSKLLPLVDGSHQFPDEMA